MKYLIRQKIFSIGDKFTIKDENDQDAFQVKGRVFSIGSKLEFQDSQGRELLFIKQELLRFLPEYVFLRNGTEVARVKRKFTFFKPSFEITSSQGNYQLSGDFFAYDFQLQKDGRPVAWVSKKWFSFTDSYGVDVDPQEDPAFVLALVIVLDQVLHPSGRN